MIRCTTVHIKLAKKDWIHLDQYSEFYDKVLFVT